MGPFYCPTDRRIYLDTSFFREIETRFRGCQGNACKFSQAYVIAHEIGHLKLHDGHPLIVDKLVRVNMRRAASLPSDKEEVAANKFAAQLLMPTEQLRREFGKAIPKRGPTSADLLVAHLSKIFAVSPQAMTYRLRELSLLSEMSLF